MFVGWVFCSLLLMSNLSIGQVCNCRIIDALPKVLHWDSLIDIFSWVQQKWTRTQMNYKDNWNWKLYITMAPGPTPIDWFTYRLRLLKKRDSYRQAVVTQRLCLERVKERIEKRVTFSFQSTTWIPAQCGRCVSLIDKDYGGQWCHRGLEKG